MLHYFCIKYYILKPAFVPSYGGWLRVLLYIHADWLWTAKKLKIKGNEERPKNETEHKNAPSTHKMKQMAATKIKSTWPSLGLYLLGYVTTFLLTSWKSMGLAGNSFSDFLKNIAPCIHRLLIVLCCSFQSEACAAGWRCCCE